MTESVNEIRDVTEVSRDTDGCYICQCPHCGRVMAIEGDRMSDIRGEQYQDICGGWLEVSRDARFVEELDPDA